MSDSRLRSSTLLRMLIVAAITLFLLIPAVYVQSLVDERQERYETAAREVSQSWGGAQTVIGPVLTVPYTCVIRSSKGDARTETRYAHLLPARLDVQSTLEPEVRYRGIYRTAVYDGSFAIEGAFAPLDVSGLGIPAGNVRWDEAFVTVGVSDLRGLQDTVSLQWDGKSYASSPGTGTDETIRSGLTFRPVLTPGARASFAVTLSLRGTGECAVVPIGEVTTASLSSAWAHPGFVGGFLPAEREISPDGFKATWKVLSFNRSFPQAWTGARTDLEGSAFGVRLYLPVDQYHMTTRTVKYALLFIVLTFASLFISEMLTGSVLHPIQYALIGFALVLFYLLLLSLSEHLGFDIAYALSTLSTLGLVSTYARWISPRTKLSLVTGGVLGTMYLFLYITLQLQDFALLIGTLGLLSTLFAVMYATRKIDWFAMRNVAGEGTA